MRTSDQTHRAPVLAAYSPVTGAREPVEFGVAASRVTGAPLVIVVVVDSGAQAVTLLTHDESVPGSIAATVDYRSARNWPIFAHFALPTPSACLILKGLLSGRTPSLLTFLLGDT